MHLRLVQLQHLLLHKENEEIVSVTVCERDPHEELWVFMSQLDPFWGDEPYIPDTL